MRAQCAEYRGVGAGVEPDDVAAEPARLREENARLHASLGLDVRPADDHTVAGRPTLLSSQPDGPVIDRNASNAAKLQSAPSAVP
jgi:hypothetical protein